MSSSPKEFRDKQIEAGKQILKDMLRELAIQLRRPEIAELTFTERTFDEPEEVSLIDAGKRVVTNIRGDDLADAPTTPPREQQLRDTTRKSVIAFFEKE